MLAFGVMVVVNRNPVASALSLVVSFLGLAALFVSLDAYFIGVVQILVYAGAVMVLFLFIIMLLDLKAEARRKINIVPMIGGCVLTLGLVLQLVSVLNSFEPGKKLLIEAPIEYGAAAAQGLPCQRGNLTLSSAIFLRTNCLTSACWVSCSLPNSLSICKSSAFFYWFQQSASSFSANEN